MHHCEGIIAFRCAAENEKCAFVARTRPKLLEKSSFSGVKNCSRLFLVKLHKTLTCIKKAAKKFVLDLFFTFRRSSRPSPSHPGQICFTAPKSCLLSAWVGKSSINLNKFDEFFLSIKCPGDRNPTESDTRWIVIMQKFPHSSMKLPEIDFSFKVCNQVWPLKWFSLLPPKMHAVMRVFVCFRTNNSAFYRSTSPYTSWQRKTFNCMNLRDSEKESGELLN